MKPYSPSKPSSEAAIACSTNFIQLERPFSFFKLSMSKARFSFSCCAAWFNNLCPVKMPRRHLTCCMSSTVRIGITCSSLVKRSKVFMNQRCILFLSIVSTSSYGEVRRYIYLSFVWIHYPIGLGTSSVWNLMRLVQTVIMSVLFVCVRICNNKHSLLSLNDYR